MKLRGRGADLLIWVRARIIVTDFGLEPDDGSGDVQAWKLKGRANENAVDKHKLDQQSSE